MTQQQALRLFEEKRVRELVTNCYQLKLQSTDGKYYKSDVADTEQLFRIIQSSDCRFASLRGTKQSRSVGFLDCHAALAMTRGDEWTTQTWFRFAPPRFASLRGTKQSRGVGFLDCRAALAMTRSDDKK